MTKTTPISSLQTHLCFLFFFLLFSHASSQSFQEQERAVLLKLKSYLKSPPFLSHWIPSTPNTSSHCSWPEITCTNGSVTGLSLVDKNITQAVPPFICDLKNLTVVDFNLNYLPGEFPTSLYNCSKLEYLDLSQNSFRGKIPDDIDSLPRLQYLNLGGNYFSGDIPAAIGRLQDLGNLQLFMNQFNGSVPPEIGNLSNLEFLNLSFNIKLVPWELPSNFTQLKKLKACLIRESNLIGELPGSLGQMAALEKLDLAINSLSGTVPDGLFLLKNLSIVYLFKNRLSRNVPQVVEAMKLSDIDLSENNLTGPVPDYGNLTMLSWLNLAFNGFSGEIPESIGRLPNLIVLRLFNNNLSGTLPPDFGRYSKLEEFQVSSNRLSGKLPEHLCHGGKLVGLVAFENNLSGELPSSLGNCSSLLTVSVKDNMLSGNIPSGMWTALNLTQVMLTNNSFTGELPEKISRNLLRLEMRGNKFSGQIPTGISSWRNLKVFDAGNNLFSGSIPQELTDLPSLLTLSLDQNQLSGFLPSDIKSWKSLTALNLSRNQLSGPIPDKLGLLPGLNVLDLSENQFSGQIPAQLGLLRLNNLNLSSNHLSGRIPTEFENAAYDRSFLDNQGLCATKPSAKLTICNSEPRKSSKISSKNLALILSSSILLSLLAFVLSFFLVRSYWMRNGGSDANWKLTSFQRLNFTVSKILSGLTESNMIGSGGSGKVYCVPVNRTGGVVAVKKIWNNKKLEEKLEKEFLAEVKILSSIRHANIVKLMCCISSDNSKLLVYEYSENRSLDRWLHGKNRPSNLSSSVHHVVLDWPKRLQIAVGAAQGLCYMHHDCVPPVVHRDVKSSNILLDSDFNAKIADFGLARMLVKQGELATMSAVAGSFGYIAPEYAHTSRVNEKIDVYSFGVILLELTTGKEANEGDEHTSLVEWAWRHVREENPIADALDKDIKEPSYLDEMSSVFKLGVYCTEKLPSSRPSMKEVLQILLRCVHPVVSREKTDDNAAPLLKNSRRERILEDYHGSLATNV